MISDEEAKAVQEVAKAATENKDNLRAVGEFFSSIVKHPATQIGGIIGDAVGVLRLELLMKYRERVDRLSKARGVDIAGTLPLATVYPLLEAAALEQDEDVAELFANLLVSYSDAAAKNYYIPKGFIETARGLNPFEARILKFIADAPGEMKDDAGKIVSAGIPEYYAQVEAEYLQTPKHIELALSHLRQLGLVDGYYTFGGGTSLGRVGLSSYGEALIEAAFPR